MATKTNQPAAASTTPNYTGPFITVTALYFIFGFITNLNMQLVPHLRSVFDLPWFQAALANGAFFTAYFVVSSPTSKLIESIGYKRTMVVSLFVQVAGALLFLPAASIPNFWLFLTAVFIVGSGVAMLQTSANPYVSALGPESSAPVRQNLAQAFNSIGGMIAPLVAGALILKHKVVLDAATLATKSAQEQLAYKISIASTVRMPYLAIAAALVLLGIAVSFAHLPTIKNTQEFRPTKEGVGLLEQSIWSYQHTVLATLGIFFLRWSGSRSCTVHGWILRIARGWSYDGSGRRSFYVLLLAWRTGWKASRFVDAHQDPRRETAGFVWSHGRLVCGDID